MACPVIQSIVFILGIFLTGGMADGTCGTTGRRCIQDRSACINSRVCVCAWPFIWGDPYFMCYKDNQVAAESRYDPSLTTFNRETTDFPFPCRYLMTHLRLQLKDRSKNVIGSCEFQVHVFNKISKGKIVTHGFDIAANVSYNNGTQVERSARKYGTAASGVNDFTLNSVHNYVPDGPWTPSVNILYEDNLNGITIECYQDTDNSQLVFELMACGLRITFVPYDTVDRREQQQVPGFSVVVDYAYRPNWLSNNRVIGLAPYFRGGQLLSEIIKPGLTISQSLVDRAFLSGALQNQPDAYRGCSHGYRTLVRCTDAQRRSAYNSCYWMLTEAKFIKCVDKSHPDIVFLFLRCVASWCEGGDCSAIVRRLSTFCRFITGVPKYTEFLSGALCP